MDEKTLAELGSALFAAQNSLCYARSYSDCQQISEGIEQAQEEIRRMVRILGGVDSLIEAGA